MTNLDAAALTTIISALVSSAIAALVSLGVTRSAVRKQDEMLLHSEIMHMNGLAIQYPFLEQDSFCNSYDEDAQDDMSLRYDNYCCIVFNILEKLHRFHKGNKTAIEGFFGVQEVVGRHRKWWTSTGNQRDIAYGYPMNFIQYVDSYL